MSEINTIQYVKNKDINRDLWDACINKAENGLIYAYSFYLDSMCTNWDALIINDYEAVMPIPWRVKWGITYIYQPAFVQRLGIFGRILSQIETNFVYQQAFKRFHFIHYNISQPFLTEGIINKKLNNFLIPLDKNYQSISAAYSKDCSKNIRKARNLGCQYSTQFKLEEVIQLYQSAYGHLNPQLQLQDYKNLYHLVSKALIEEKATIAGVKTNEGVTLFAAIIFRDNKRLYYVFGAPTPEGRTKSATYFFIDEVLKINAGTHLLFDFEGSDIPNVAAFYQRFSPFTEYYYELKINKLPKIIQWLKK